MPQAAFSLARPAPDDSDRTRLFIDSHVTAPNQRRLLHSLLDHFPAGERSPYVDIPRLVYGGITGCEEEAVPLTALGKFLFLGMDIMDDIADGDAEDHWPGHNMAELQLGSSLFLSALPQILIADLKAPEGIRTQIQQRFARGLLETAAGQQLELGMTEKMDIDPQKVEDSVRGKSSGVATLASIAARLAGATGDQINAYEEMGYHLGSAAQIATDFYDLFQTTLSRDLRNGTRTLPIALCLAKCSEDEKKILFGPLEEARSLLFSKGIGRLTAFIIELYCERARKNLSLADPKAIYRVKLDSLINHISFFREDNQPRRMAGR